MRTGEFFLYLGMESKNDLKGIVFLKQGRFYLIMSVLFILFGAAALVNTEPKYDEKYFHLPMLEKFIHEDWLQAATSAQYAPVNTPLPYIISSIPFRLLSEEPGIASARIINILIGFIVICLFYFLAPEDNKMYTPLILFFYPYFLKPSFTYFMSIYGLLFFLLTLIFLYKRGLLNIFIAGMFNALAVLSQQFYLTVPAGLFLYKLVFTKEKKDLKIVVKVMTVFCFPLIIPFILFLYWGGLEPATARDWSTSFQPANVTAVMMIMGSVLLLFFIYRFADTRKGILLIFLGVAIILASFASPYFSNVPQVGSASGYTFQIIDYAVKINSILPFVLRIILITAGCSAFYYVYKNISNEKERLLFCLSLTFIAGFFINTLISERHLLPLIALIYLLVIPKIKNKVFLNIFFISQIILGSVYFYYWLFIQKHI